MIEALGTLPFLVTLWLLVVLGAKVLEESGAKIAAALKGTPPHQHAAGGSIRIRMRQSQAVMRSGRQWRAAA